MHVLDCSSRAVVERPDGGNPSNSGALKTPTLGGVKDTENTSKSTRFQCSTETVNSIDHSERVENLAPWRHSGATNGRMFQGSGALLDWNGCCARAVFSGWWCYTILIAVVWSIAARQVVVCGAEIYSAPNAAFNIWMGWIRLAEYAWLN